MPDPQVMKTKLSRAFTPPQAALLAEVITETLDKSYQELVKVHDFTELKEIVRNLSEKMERLAQAQERTEERVGGLERAMARLAEAQERTEARMESLAEAQERTEARMESLAQAQQKTEEAMAKLARGLDATRADLGGLARSVAYSLENEAYRALPALMRQHGIEVTERFVRTEVDGEEINLLGKGRRNGAQVVIVGEAELRLTTIKKVKQLLRKADIVAEKYPGEIVKILITHYARPQVIEKAGEQGVLVVQSFEWL